jgi:ribose 5-phosphate isomerase B
MTIFIGADHRGLDLKNKLVEYLQDKDIRVEDLGAYEPDPEDDYPDFGFKVAQAVRQNPEEYLGVLICGGGGISMAANRFPEIRSTEGFDEEQVKHIRENDHVNVLAIPADYVDVEQAKKFVDIFIETPLKQDEKYLRRVKKLSEIEIKPVHTIPPAEEQET